MKKIVAALVVALAALGLVAGHAEPPVAVGLLTPESAAWDPGTQQWFIGSERGGGFPPVGSGGYISTVAPDGTILAEEWVTGLSSPFGIDVHDGVVYAGDQGNLVAIDIATAQILWSSPLPAGSANDVEVDAATGDVYVSSTGTNQIFVFPAGDGVPVGTEFLAMDGGVNGLLAEDGILYVVTLGFDTLAQGGGRIFAVSIDDPSQVTPVSEHLGALDGLVRYGDDFIVTDFVGGRIYRVGPDGSGTLVADTGPATADLGIDAERGIIAVPNTGASIVYFLPV